MPSNLGLFASSMSCRQLLAGADRVAFMTGGLLPLRGASWLTMSDLITVNSTGAIETALPHVLDHGVAEAQTPGTFLTLCRPRPS